MLLETYEAMSKDRLLAVAAGVVFYGLLAIFPAITALVSSYGLFANASAIQDNLSLLANVLPAGGISIVQEQIDRIAAQPSGLSVGFAVGLMIALWSANAGVKAMIDALNVIEGQDESRSFVRLNLLSLTMTLGAIVFLLLAVGAVVAFPLVMSTFGLKDFTATTTWLIRWPLLLALMVGALTVFYRFGPSRQSAPRWWFSPGAVIAALLWLAGSAALSFYLSNFADYNATYGSLGAAIGLMMWMWLSTIAVLLGAQLDTRDRAEDRPAASIEPVVEDTRVPVTECSSSRATQSAPVAARCLTDLIRIIGLAAQLGLRLFLGGGGVVRRARVSNAGVAAR